MIPRLRPYQIKAIEAAEKAFEKKKNFIIQMATGAGKSLVIAELCYRNPQKTLVLVPSKELLEQDLEKMKMYGIDDIKVYSASMNSKEIGNYTIATIGSVYKKPELFQEFNRIIIDECHLVGIKNLNSMYAKFLNEIGNPTVCGLTATPYRIEQKYFTDEKTGLLYATASLKMLTRIWTK